VVFKNHINERWRIIAGYEKLFRAGTDKAKNKFMALV